MVEFHILGPLEVVASGEAVSLRGARPRALLALLLVNAGESVSVDRVIDELWGERPPATAQHAVQVYVSGVRRLLRISADEVALRRSAAGYRLEVDPGRVDARRFERMIEEAGRLAGDDPARARELFGEALALWRGPPLPEFRDFRFAAGEADRLEELRALALERTVETALACGEHGQAIGTLTSLIAADPLRESPRRLLMLALYRTGRHAEALAVYRDACAALDEIGLQPGPELRALEEQILRHDRSLAAPRVGEVPTSFEQRTALLGAATSVEVVPVPPSTEVARPFEGTVALLFTDIEGSTRLASKLGASWKDVLSDHHALLKNAISSEGGFIASSEGDAFFATFADVARAARAAEAAFRALEGHSWPPEVGELKLRMGLHVGYVEWSPTGYVGLEIHRAARVAAAAHGGQLLLTASAKALLRDAVVGEPLGLHRLKDFPAPEPLYCAVVEGRGAAAFPAPRTEAVRPTNLPAGVPWLVGRDVEIGRVRQALLDDGGRLVTLTGQGGVGKTSLALVCAESLLDEFPSGVWLARLATLTSPDDVLAAIEAALGGERKLEVSPSAAIAMRLQGRGMMLVILDNFEHLLPAAGSVAGLLDVVPELSVLITSQAPLRLAAERVMPVGPLDGDAALSLVEHVSRQRSAPFDGDEEQRKALSEVVSIVEGLPLALELATASLSILTPAQLRDRLRSSTEMLRDDRRDREPRHRSLRASVPWTFDALGQDQRELFVRLGAFAGPVELEEIEAVVGADGLDVVTALAGLVDVALVRRIESGDSRIRFGSPEALRQIASAMLDDAEDGARWREAHLLRQHELLWNARTYLVTEVAYQRALAADLEAAAALRWAQSTDHPLAASLAAARAARLYDSGRLREAKSLLERLLSCPPEDPDLLGYVYLVNVWLLTFGHDDEALDAVEKALALATDPYIRSSALVERGILHLKAGRFHEAVVDHERATVIARELGATELSFALVMESQARIDAGQLELGAQLLTEAEQLGMSSGAKGPWPCHEIRGRLALLSGQPLKAIEHVSRSLEVARQKGDAVQVYLDLVGLTDALAMSGRDEEALEIAGIAEAHAADIGIDRGSNWHAPGRDPIRESSSRLGAQAAERSRTGGRAVPISQRAVRACELARAAADEQRSNPAPVPQKR